MEATSNIPFSIQRQSFGRELAGFLFLPILLLLIAVGTAVYFSNQYEKHTADRIYAGVSINSVDVSNMTQAEAAQAIQSTPFYVHTNAFTFVHPHTGETFSATPSDIGLTMNIDATVASAFKLGRSKSNRADQIREQLNTYLYGITVTPTYKLDMGEINSWINQFAPQIEQSLIQNQLDLSSGYINVAPGQAGYTLDREHLFQQIYTPLRAHQSAQIELLVHEIEPESLNLTGPEKQLELTINRPFNFYLKTPLDDVDLTNELVISPSELATWSRLYFSLDADGNEVYTTEIDTEAVRAWLTELAVLVEREPVNARFYFDDTTRELVVVDEHINGRSLNVDATLASFVANAESDSRSLPLIIDNIIPKVNTNATAAELGITELLTEQTTYFRDSPPERKHNIARSAEKFYGIVIAPGEEFSFNRYIGEISEEDGFTTGLIILGGRTIEGVGGGVCQVSTTVFQSAFWAGYPIVERQEHGYRVHYYEDGEGAGMDATIFTGLVDFKFLNNTPFHILMENYYSAEEESLTMKLYTTSLGRHVEKANPIIEDVQPARTPDLYEYNEDLDPQEIKLVDYAAEGAKVTINRTVYNAEGLVMEDRDFVSNYIPWRNVHQYGDEAIIPELDDAGFEILPTQTPDPEIEALTLTPEVETDVILTPEGTN